MTDRQLLERIASHSKILAGKPVIQGTRLSVEHVLNLLAHGATFEDILREYEGLTTEDIRACLLFASRTLEDTGFMPLTSGNP